MTKLKTSQLFEDEFKFSVELRKILIANNGIAALKFIRSIRHWCYCYYNNVDVVHFVAMVTSEDLNANAEYAQLADEIVSVPSGPSHLNYSNVDLIVELAQEIPVEAVWAGWGHASENPRLSELLSEKNILFLGPKSSAMTLLGDKISATIIAQSLHIPTLDWSGNNICVQPTLNGSFEAIPSEIYKKALIPSVDSLKVLTDHVGFPLLLKASEGGGGKGIRLVHDLIEAQRSFHQISTEVPNSPIFAVKILKMARHIEIQLLGDYYGNVVALFSRDCSIQRRYQKIIEEAPAIICPEHILKMMETDAIKMAKSVGYYSAGTVEYLYDVKTQNYYFLELNPRLQVEHPCTEMIADINLPGSQLEISLGKNLEEILKMQQLKFRTISTSDNICAKGHVISARITAESAEDGFRPSSGSLRKLNFRNSKNVWGYFSVHAEGSLHKYADSQFGHLFSWGENREDARKGMVLALKELSVHGEIRTTIDFLVNVMEHRTFVENNVHNEWLDAIKGDSSMIVKPSIKIIVICGACCIGQEKISKLYNSYEKSLERGHFPNFTELVSPVHAQFIYLGTKYSVSLTKASENSLYVIINNSSFYTQIYPLGKNCLLISIGDKSYTCHINEESLCYSLEIGSISCILSKDVDLSILRAPSPGKIISLLAKDGEYLYKGTDYAEMEVMKMVMPLSIHESGYIHYVKSVNSMVESGDIIATMQLDDNTKSQSVVPFSGNFDSFDNASSHSGLSDISSFCSNASNDNNPGCSNVSRKMYKTSYQNLLNILDGYCIPEPNFSQNLSNDIFNLASYISQPSFIFSTLSATLYQIKNYLPQHIYLTIGKLIREYSINITSIIYELPINEILSVLETHASVLGAEDERSMFFGSIDDFVQLLKQLRHGPKYYRLMILVSFLDKYLSVESIFAFDNFEHSVSSILPQASIENKPDKSYNYNEIVRLIVSHANVFHKNKLILFIIDLISDQVKYFNELDEDLKQVMLKLSNLASNKHLKVALRAKKFLISSMKPSFELRHNQLESIFLSILSGTTNKSVKILNDVIDSDGVIIDILPNFFFSSNTIIQTLALEVYIRRAYFPNDLLRLYHTKHGDIPVIKFLFKSKKKYLRQNILKNDESKNNSEKAHNEFCDQNVKLTCGIMTRFKNFEEMSDYFPSFLPFINETNIHEKNELNVDFFSHLNSDTFARVCRVVTICISIDSTKPGLQDYYAEICQDFIRHHLSEISDANINMMTFIFTDLCGEMPFIFHYRSRTNFMEDRLLRHVETSARYLIELKKLNNFNLECMACENPNIYIYHATSKQPCPQSTFDSRFFVRTIVRNAGLISVEASFDYMVKTSEVRLLEVLDQLDIIASKMNKSGYNNHILFIFTPCIVIDPVRIFDCIQLLVLRHRMRLFKQKISQAEMKMTVLLEPHGKPITFRLVVSNQCGYLLKMDLYKEVLDLNQGKVLYKSIGRHDIGPLDGTPVDAPYACLDEIEKKRIRALELGSVYIYDYPVLFMKALHQESLSHHRSIETDIDYPESATFQELILCTQTNQLIPAQTTIGQNTVGLVIFKSTFYQHFGKRGQEVIIVGNDVTHTLGSFTEKEAAVFKAAGMYARNKKIPLIYLCCSSGARIGLAKEVMEVFKVKWVDENFIGKGIDYLYLEESDYLNLSKTKSVRCEKVVSENGVHFKITDIFGNGIGVENLRGSGLIAGEMSSCYDEIFTISLVSGRAVGIGAYLVRLGRRVVQIDKSSIILTGSDALNRLLGRNVYSSHQQLGGVDIMFNNGVSQIVAKDHFDGVRKVVKWLQYQNISFHSHLLTPSQLMSSVILVHPEQIPRNLLSGYIDISTSKYVQGFFDEGSVFEINKGWAKTLITGRARLGSIPVAFIINDNKSIKTVIPADPADSNDIAKEYVSVGQVLSPEASFKFSQSIDDANHECLPLFIFANFRGFSAGMKDMYNQVLKFGAMIVSSLRKYTKPVFIYILPKGELRGGSWAILDTEINPDFIEMYSSDTGYANILEPSGTVAVKYRKNEINKTIRRLNPCVKSQDTCQSSINGSQDLEERKNKTDELYKAYQDVAEFFASLHDTPTRMLEKGVIREIIPWEKSRTFFLQRLKYKMLEYHTISKILVVDSSLSYSEAKKLLESWFLEVCLDNGYSYSSIDHAIRYLQSLHTGERNPFFLEKLSSITLKVGLKTIKSLVTANPTLTKEILLAHLNSFGV